MDPATIAMLLQLAPAAINAVGSLFKRPQQQPQVVQGQMPQMPQMEPGLTWEQALQQAQAQMAPLMRQYDQQAMSRGFYGQMPNDVVRSDYGAAAQGQMAQQLMQQDWQRRFNQQQAAADWMLKQGSLNLGQQQINQQGRQAGWQNAMQFGNNLWQGYKDVADLIGELPWSGGQNTAWFNQQTAQQTVPTTTAQLGHQFSGMVTQPNVPSPIRLY